jgi:hypothetical protein
MCEIIGKTRKRMGYKVLAYKNNKYYSTFSGQEIKLGTVPQAPSYCRRLSSFWSDQILDGRLSSCGFYNKKFANKTSAFIDVYNARRLARDIKTYLSDKSYSIVIVKITFTGVVFYGNYSNSEGNIIAGDNIKTIKSYTR